MPYYRVLRNFALPIPSGLVTGAGEIMASAGELVFIQAPGELVPFGDNSVRILNPRFWLPHLDRLLEAGDLEPNIIPSGAMPDDAGGLVLSEGAPPPFRLPLGSISFRVGGGTEVLRFDPDDKMYVQGRLVEADSELVAALRWFVQQGAMPSNYGSVSPEYKIPKYALGQKVRWEWGGQAREGKILAAYEDIAAVREIHLARGARAPRLVQPDDGYRDDQVFYQVQQPDKTLWIVGESDVEPVVPTDLPERADPPTVWERLSHER